MVQSWIVTEEKLLQSNPFSPVTVDEAVERNVDQELKDF